MKYSVMMATVFLTGFGAPAPGLASCNDVNLDLCSVAECRHRQSHVHPTCDVKRSCASVLPSQRDTLREYRARNENCAAARQYVTECFGGADAGHQEAIDSALRAANVCAVKLGEE
ncbi:MAG: hypothetical protein RIE06_06755 [Roseibium album]|uniref:hypothetical protein n=1 Tax=Roseibium album TaxID=311410 RepID=UPI0018CBB3AF|nr:hypothetical protein [Roseibium album]MBG6199879.1 hypothetical protein [Labrenzia sp. EL_13]